jgi:hypothetical protein
MTAHHSNRNSLLTRVRNVSGHERSFGYLGTHGIRLANNEVFLLRGNLVSTLGAKLSARKFQALERDLVAGVLKIEQTPPPCIYDPVARVSKVLTRINGVLGVLDPEWDTSGLSDYDVEAE